MLEVGVGTGRNLALVAQRYPQARLFGIDISEDMLAIGRSKIKAKKLNSESTKQMLIDQGLKNELIIGKDWKWEQ